MKKIKMLAGREIELDGDLMAIIESLYQEVVLKKELKHTYKDIKQEIENIVAQMPEVERKTYLVESLFLNSVIYENQMLDALIKRLNKRVEQD